MGHKLEEVSKADGDPKEIDWVPTISNSVHSGIMGLLMTYLSALWYFVYEEYQYRTVVAAG